LEEAVTRQTEEFLESIYRLQERDGVARTSELVGMLKVVPGTVTNTVERLEKKGLVLHETYKGVALTTKGREIALRILRRHRLSERLLTDVLSMKWNQVHEAACGLEHGVTEDIAKNIEETLGWPRTCPHGNPIPSMWGGVAEERSGPLLGLKPGQAGVVTRITDEKKSTLDDVERLGLRPGAHIEVLEMAAPKGPVTARIDHSDETLSQEIASVIMVEMLPRSSETRQVGHDEPARSKN